MSEKTSNSQNVKICTSLTTRSLVNNYFRFLTVAGLNEQNMSGYETYFVNVIKVYT